MPNKATDAHDQEALPLPQQVRHRRWRSRHRQNDNFPFEIFCRIGTQKRKTFPIGKYGLYGLGF